MLNLKIYFCLFKRNRTEGQRDMMSEHYLIEDYRAAKAELLSTIDQQFKILSILVTATAAVFVYLFKKDVHQLVFCACLIIPGIYAFFGALWLDQVYRQRRLAAYIYEVESTIKVNSTSSFGWEHFIQRNRESSSINKPSRRYYYICLGLFFGFPPVTFVFSCLYRGGNVLDFHHDMFWPALLGVFLYFFFLVAAGLYIWSIKKLSNSFSDNNTVRDQDSNNVEDDDGNFGAAMERCERSREEAGAVR